MKKHSSIQTILNKDVLTESEFNQARKELRAFNAIAEAALECSQWNCGRPINAVEAFEKLDAALEKLSKIQSSPVA